MPQDWLQFFPSILKYGATGLSALLFFFAYLLLREQCKKETSDPKALMEIRIYMFISVFLAVISLVSSIFCSPQQEELADAAEFNVTGTVKKEDGGSSTGITVITGYPPLTASPEGKIIGLKVWRDPKGELPILTFNASGYYAQPIPLREHEESMQDNVIDIGEVTLMKEEE